LIIKGKISAIISPPWCDSFREFSGSRKPGLGQGVNLWLSSCHDFNLLNWLNPTNTTDPTNPTNTINPRNTTDPTNPRNTTDPTNPTS